MIVLLKIIGSFLLVICFLVGATKASPRFHSPAHPPLAEYGTGFIMCAAALAGLYYLWT